MSKTNNRKREFMRKKQVKGTRWENQIWWKAKQNNCVMFYDETCGREYNRGRDIACYHANDLKAQNIQKCRHIRSWSIEITHHQK